MRMRTHSTELGHRANIVKFNIYKPSPAEWPDSAQTVRRGPLISLSQAFFCSDRSSRSDDVNIQSTSFWLKIVKKA